MIFFKAHVDMPDPRQAADGLSGEIPLRAYQHCEPFLAANRVGYLLHPPSNFVLTWDGADVYAEFDGIDEIVKVSKCFLPGFADYWMQNAPAEMADLMPPFLEAFPERGIVQIWTGFFVSTPEHTSTWIRSPINRKHSRAYEIVEGIVETDWWAGMLFTNIQFLKTDEPIEFKKEDPWLQVFEVPNHLHAKQRLSRLELTAGVEAFPEDLWRRMGETLERRNSQAPGSYRAEARRRRP